jgi:hypothetical protein
MDFAPPDSLKQRRIAAYHAKAESMRSMSERAWKRIGDRGRQNWPSLPYIQFGNQRDGY